MRSSGSIPISCFLLSAIFSVFSLTLAIFFRWPLVTVSSSYVISRFLSYFSAVYLFICVFFFVILRLHIYLFINLFSSICFPVQQTTNRIGNRVLQCFCFVDMVGARSVNVMNNKKKNKKNNKSQKKKEKPSECARKTKENEGKRLNFSCSRAYVLTCSRAHAFRSGNQKKNALWLRLELTNSNMLYAGDHSGDNLTR